MMEQEPQMHQNKINLLHLITGLGVGGAERVVLDLAKNADKKKFKVSVISMSKRIEMLDEFQQNNVDITALKKNNSINDFFQIISYLNNYVKQHKIKVIHAHMTHSMILSVIVKVLNKNIKIVFTSHSISFGSKFRKVLIHILKPFRNKDILFSTEQMSSIYRKNYTIIPNGIDTTTYQKKNIKFETFTFLSVGRLEHVKNHMRLLKCAIEFKKNKKKIKILIAGEGNQRRKYEQYILANNLEEDVILLGLRSDISALMAKSHVFVMPSLWEGLPIVLLEAGATGIPVISTPVGTIPSLIDKTNGYLVNENNFFKMMEYMINHYSEAEQKALKLKTKVVNEYSIKSIVHMHESVYAKLIEKKI